MSETIEALVAVARGLRAAEWEHPQYIEGILFLTDEQFRAIVPAADSRALSLSVPASARRHGAGIPVEVVAPGAAVTLPSGKLLVLSTAMHFYVIDPRIGLLAGAPFLARTNVYGRVLPTDRQRADSAVCVDCGHPHWDHLIGRYVRCAMCGCENVGRNEIPAAADWPAARCNVVDEIAALVDEQLRQERSGYDRNINQERCPHCGRHWHGLPITSRVAEMYATGTFDPAYTASADTTPVVCGGSTFIGPMPAPPGATTPSVARADVASSNPVIRCNGRVHRSADAAMAVLAGGLNRWWRIQPPDGLQIAIDWEPNLVTLIYGARRFTLPGQHVRMNLPRQHVRMNLPQRRDGTIITRAYLDVLAANAPDFYGCWEPLTAPGVTTHPDDDPAEANPHW